MIRASRSLGIVAPADPRERHVGDHRLSVAVILYFLMIALPFEFNLGSIFMTGVRTILLVVTVPLSLRLITGQFGRILITDILLPVYGIWCIGALFVNSPDQAVSFGGSHLLEVYGSYLLARACIRTPGQFRAACNGLFVILIFSLPFALYETQTGVAPLPLMIEKLPGFFSVADFYNADAGRRLGLERSQVMFAHPIHYGVFCVSLFSLAFVAMRDRIGSLRRYLLSAAVWVGIIASVSSGAILPLAMQLGLIGWARVLGDVKRRWIILTAITVAAYVTVDLLSNRTPIVILLEYVALSPDTAYGRVIIFEWGMVNIWKHPLLGIGMNDWERPWWNFSSSMDNFWLLETVRYGIPGFLMLAVAYAALVWGAMRRDLGAGGEAWLYRRAWVFSQLGMIMALCTVDVWATMLSFTFFLFGMGTWFVHHQPSEEPQTSALPTPAEPPMADAGRRASPYTRFAGTRERNTMRRPPK